MEVRPAHLEERIIAIEDKAANFAKIMVGER